MHVTGWSAVTTLSLTRYRFEDYEPRNFMEAIMVLPPNTGTLPTSMPVIQLYPLPDVAVGVAAAGAVGADSGVDGAQDVHEISEKARIMQNF